MRFITADDFDIVKNRYIDVIENTPELERHSRWVYGKHPNDEELRSFIDHKELYLLMDDDSIAGMVVITMYQDKSYEKISWGEELADDEVATLHLLAVCPEYQGRGLGRRILEEAAKAAKKSGKKAIRLDTMISNLPAQRMYKGAGYSYRGKQKLFTGNAGWTDFLYFEKLLDVV